jgi:uncharacterized protein
MRFLRKHWILATALLLGAVCCMTPHSLERLFVYFPERLLEGDPGTIGLAFQELRLTTTDGISLHGWFVPHAEANVTILLLHGNGGNISHRLPWTEIIHGLKAHVMLFDYRGYGRSAGRPFEQGLYRDAAAAYNWWARERAPRGERLVLFGESLGGAVAVDLAARTQPAGLILQSTFTSARDMARTMMPLGLLQPLAGVYFDSATKIGGVKCPKLFIHGSRDPIVPIRLGRGLFERAPEPKSFYEVPGAGHNDLPWEAGPEYQTRLRLFLEKLIPGKGNSAATI